MAEPLQALERIRREIAAAISSRAKLEYVNRHWALFDLLSEMRSHRPLLGPLVVQRQRGRSSSRRDTLRTCH